MKVKFIFLYLIAGSIISFTSCEDKDNKSRTKEQKDNEYVNSWIYDNMNLYYYWRDKIPSSKSIDYTMAPDNFFEKLLNSYNETTREGDRFSWIQNNYTDLLNSLRGVSRDIGFEYQSEYLDAGKTQVGFHVLYIKKNTDAETKGIKRGDYIIQVDGTNITPTNYTSVISSGKNNYKLRVLDVTTQTTSDITVNVMEDYKEDPIYHTDIFEKNGKKIGYIMYNFFSPDNGESDNTNGSSPDSYKYDFTLANKFKEFKDAGVTDLILDLRYNGGGRVSSAVYIASALVPNRKTSDIFSYDEFNADYQAYILREEGENALKTFFTDKINVTNNRGAVVKSGEIPQLGINKLYVIATRYSASASELVINALKAYMPVVHVGQTTVGKNVGSYSFYKENDSRNKWGMQPIVMKIFNAKGESDYTAGFIPEVDLTVNEFQYDFKSIGDENEILLATAIADITGTPKPAKTKNIKTVNIVPAGSSLEHKPGAFQMFIDNNRLKEYNKIQK